MHWRRLTSALVAAVVGVALLAGCGGDDDKGAKADGGSATTEAASKLTGTPVRFGMISAPAASVDPATGRFGAEAAVKSINASGGIDGHPVEIKYCDSGDVATATAESTAKCARELIGDKTVMAIVGSSLADSTKLAETAHMAVVGPLAGSTPDFSSKNVFLNQIGYLNVGGQAALAADVGDAKKICMPYLEGPGGVLEGMINGLVLGPRDLKLSKTVPIPYTAADVSSQVTSLKSCDAIVPAVTLDLATRLYQTARQLGIDAPMYMPGSVFSEYAVKKNLGGDASDVFIASPYRKSGAGYDAYKKDMKAIGKEGSVQDTTEAVRTWLAMQQLRDAVTKVGVDATTRESLLAQFQKTSGYDTQGLTPPLDYTKKATVGGGAFPNLVDPWVVAYEWKDGKYEPMNDGKFINPLDPDAEAPS